MYVGEYDVLEDVGRGRDSVEVHCAPQSARAERVVMAKRAVTSGRYEVRLLP